MSGLVTMNVSVSLSIFDSLRTCSSHTQLRDTGSSFDIAVKAMAGVKQVYQHDRIQVFNVVASNRATINSNWQQYHTCELQSCSGVADMDVSVDLGK